MGADPKAINVIASKDNKAYDDNNHVECLNEEIWFMSNQTVKERGGGFPTYLSKVKVGIKIEIKRDHEQKDHDRDRD